MQGIPVVVRNPYSVRPYQHVLEPLHAYLMIAQRQWEDSSYAGCYNVGPDDCDCITTGGLVDLVCAAWGEDMSWTNRYDGGPHEAGFLKLDCSRLKQVFGWRPRWSIADAVERTIEWTRVWQRGGDVAACMSEQISAFGESKMSAAKGY